MLEVALVAFLLALALIPVVAGWHSTRRRLGFTTAVFFAMAATLATAWKEDRTATQPVVNRPIEVTSEDYVSSRTCRACHPDKYATWHASYHRTMTQVAGPDTVAGDFSDVELRDQAGRMYHLTCQGDDFYVELEDPVSKNGRLRRPIVLTTGSHHYQAYWCATDEGRELGMLPFIYLMDTEQYGVQRWIPRSAAFLRPPVAPDAAAKPLKSGRWNQVCYMCHATRGQPRLHAGKHADTHAVEFGIACEACHGPGLQHITENQNPVRRYDLHRGAEPDATIINPQLLSHERSSQVCGQCHGVITPLVAEQWDRWHEEGFAYRPGDDLAETRVIDPDRFAYHEDNLKKLTGLVPSPEALLAHTFWPDGMVRVSGREYSGLVATPCYQRGTMSCLSCHQMHQSADDPRTLAEWANDQLKPGMETNEACYQCHSAYREQLEQHTYHTADSSGSLCYNCHMPHTSYGLLKGIRSHQIDIPDVAHSLAPVGRPNACNLCHLNKTLAWTADHLHQWYDIESPQLTNDQSTIAASLVWLLKGDAAQRALLAWSMGWKPAMETSGTNWMPPFLVQILLDSYDSNRFIAQRTLRRLPGIGPFDYDFMAPADERRTKIGIMLEKWSRTQIAGKRPTDKAVLFDIESNLNNSEMQRLLQQRDIRPMYLNE